MTEKLSASEVAGEIRRGYRMFRAFEKGREMIDVLVESEKRKKDLEKDITKLGQKISVLDGSITEKTNEVNQLGAEILENGKALNTVKDRIKQKEGQILDTAHAAADKILAAAKELKKFLEIENTKTQAELQSLREMRTEEHNALGGLREAIKKERKHLQQFLDA